MIYRALDLFCGLFQPEFLLCAKPTIKQLVAGRAKYPDHVTLRVRHYPPRTVSLVFRLVCHLKDTHFATGFTGGRQIRVSAAQSPNYRILEWAPRVVDFLNPGFASHEIAPLSPRRFTRAILGAIATVRAWWCDLEVRSALETVAPSFSDVVLLLAPNSASPRLAARRTISFIWPFCLERPRTFYAKQIIHAAGLSCPSH